MSDTPHEEKRDPKMLGRRKTDHSDGQVIWLEEHFHDVIKSAMDAGEARWSAGLEKTLDLALKGSIPGRVTALERYNETRALRTCLIALTSSMMGGGCVVAALLFTNLVRFA